MHEISEWLVWLTAEYLERSSKPETPSWDLPHWVIFSVFWRYFFPSSSIFLSCCFLRVVPSPFKQLADPSLFPALFAGSVREIEEWKGSPHCKFFFFLQKHLRVVLGMGMSSEMVCVCVCVCVRLLLWLSVRLWPWPLQSSCTNIYLISNGQHNAERSERNNNHKLADGDQSLSPDFLSIYPSTYLKAALFYRFICLTDWGLDCRVNFFY